MGVTSPMGEIAAEASVQQPSVRSNWRSATLSAGLHLALLALIALTTSRAQLGGGQDTGRRVDLVLMQLNEQNETEYLREAEWERSEDQLSQSLQATVPDQPVESLSEMESPDELASAIELPNLDAAGMTELAENGEGRGNRQNPLTAEEQAMIAADRERFAREADFGEEVSLSVFGSGELRGRKFVFVLDRSKSMGSNGLGVLDVAGAELQAAMSVLQPNHRFQIIAYHHKSFMISDRKLLRATADNKSRVLEFIGSLAAFGSTRHEQALMTALSLDPDIVVLLTDGDLPYLNRGQLDAIRRAAGRAQIHCVEFGVGNRLSRKGFMEQLAGENDGSYRYIDVRNLTR